MEDRKPRRKSREKQWVDALVPRLVDAFRTDSSVDICAGFRLPYRYEIHSYKVEGVEPRATKIAGYQTDLLISELLDDGWIPRVVIECKLGAVTTHDALTYSAKAATHKRVHPYLRYGILVGELFCVPSRLIHHGTQFDSMAAWKAEHPTPDEFKAFVDVLQDEVRASRLLGKLVTRHSCALIHRPLVTPDIRHQ